MDHAFFPTVAPKDITTETVQPPINIQSTGSTGSEKEARVLSKLLVFFSVRRQLASDDHSDSFVPSSSSVSSSTRSAFSRQFLRSNSSAATTQAETITHFRDESEECKDRERDLIHQFLTLSSESQKKLAQSLFVIPPSLIDNFVTILQFFMRVIIEAHAHSHTSQQPDDLTVSGDEIDTLSQQQQPSTNTFTQSQQAPRVCSWSQNGSVRCIEFHQEESSGSTTTTGATFRFPPDFHSCLVEMYGSVRRSKCEEVWHGDHMAYRCRTCGLSDSSCMCLACFDPDEHEGHDYRVYRCSSGGCCDCGDPLAWKSEGFCKKHRASANQTEETNHNLQMGKKEEAILQLLVRRVIMFCVNVLREVYLFCLRPGSAFENDSSYPIREFPKTGRRRNMFPTIIQVHLDRMQQSLSWLQMLAMSCLRYRDIVSQLFFERLPADFELDPSITLVDTEEIHGASTNDSKTTKEHNPSVGKDEGSQLLVLDVFLKAGVLLPIETCDVLGVLYLKLLFDQGFKQYFTCHFLDWYPYFIELYLKASEENNEDGMRNLSRFIDRLFCQLFHSTAQLQELETVFASKYHQKRHYQNRQHLYQMTGGMDVKGSCVEWLMGFLLRKLNGLFRSALRVETIQRRKRKLPSSSESQNANSVPVFQSIQVVDCGRNVFKKRVYARLCSDLRTLLIHPQVAAHALVSSFRWIDNHFTLLESSVYAELMQAFELLQQMDLQQRHVHQHIEYESQNWTFAFVVDYEMNLLLSAFLTGIPHCFSKDAMLNSDGDHETDATTNAQTIDSTVNNSLALARAILQPLQSALMSWVHRNGCPEWESLQIDTGNDNSQDDVFNDVMEYYEYGVLSISGPIKRSFHLPLHHMYAAVLQALCVVIKPKTVTDWEALLAFTGKDGTVGSLVQSLSFWYSLIDHPLRVSLFAREVKAGLWVRNGNVMWQQLTHYHSKHWRYFGLHSDLFICQLGATMLPRGNFTRMLLQQLPFDLLASRVFTLQTGTSSRERAEHQNGDHDNKHRLERQEVDVAEDALRLLLQIVLAPVKIASSTSLKTSAVWLLEREVMHWLSLGPYTRSEVVMHVDMKLVEQIKQIAAHPWSQLEEDEILTQVLETVGVYEDPSAIGNALTNGASNDAGDAGTGHIAGFGVKMSGKWKLRKDLWSQISPLFECFTPSEAQLSDQNVRKHLLMATGTSSPSNRKLAMGLPVLLRAEMSGVEIHTYMADKILNSSYLLGALFTMLHNWKAYTNAMGVDETTELSGVTSENLVLVALYCLYVGVNLLPSIDEVESTERKDDESELSCLSDTSELNLKTIAARFEGEKDFFRNLCVEIQKQEGDDTESFLSLLHCFRDQDNIEDDTKYLASLILDAAAIKSSICRHYLQQLKIKVTESDTIAAKSSDNRATSSATNSNLASEERARKSKEAMLERQRMILEKMRSQQLKFLATSGQSNEEMNPKKNVKTNEEGDEINDADDAETDEEIEDEDDEWGFPTGQVDIQLYLDHISSAITLECEKERKVYDRRRRLRRSARRNSENPRNIHGFALNNITEGEEDEKECGLCRLPCKQCISGSTFGVVGMIQPTCIPQKMSGMNSMKSSSLSSMSFTTINSDGMTVMQLENALVRSCGHSIHNECLKAYLQTLWKQQQNRIPIGMVNGDDRVLCERDKEFMCPVCRRLSNCLIPNVPSTEIQMQAQRPLSSREIVVEEESKEEARESTVFLDWLKSQMKIRTDPMEVKTRRLRAMSSLSWVLNSSQPDRKQDIGLERELGRFSQSIVSHCLRAQMVLPLLMKGISDERSLDLEIQRVMHACNYQLPTWEILMRCMQLQIDVVLRELELFKTNTIDKQRMQSMRQLAEAVSTASSLSAENSVAWSVIGTPHEKKFDIVINKLNRILFGHQVLFEDDAREVGGAIVAGADINGEGVFVEAPVLCHPNLSTFFLMRMVWHRVENSSSGGIVIQRLMSEAYFLARVLLVAQILQALCYICMQDQFQINTNSSQTAVTEDKSNGGFSEFNDVESMKDAFRWVFNLLTRSRLISRHDTTRKSGISWNMTEVEQAVAAMCLPLAKQMALIMDVLIPMNRQDEPEEVCAVCDGLYQMPNPESDRNVIELEKYLRRLHMPPLRLFFHRQTLSASQRRLCQLWGAQLESKAAVARQQARQEWSTVFFPFMKQLSIAGEKKASTRLIISLPRVYMDLFIKYTGKPSGHCRKCNQLPQHPAICLLCGDVVCCFSSCCEAANGNIGECTQHAHACGLGLGAFLLLRACTVILFLGNERRCVWGSVYLDKNGEEDPYLRRGKALYLDASRVLALEALLVSHGFAQNTSILANTSRRDGRRY